MSNTILACKDLQKSFTNVSGEGSLTILSGVNLSIAAGESVAIVGASGSGKTSLLSLLAGLDLPTSGQIWLAGEDITQMDEEQRCQLRARSVGFIFQGFELLPSMSAVENVMLPLELQSSPKARELAKQALERVGLQERAGHYPQQLSGGEQQRVGIARAFVTQPKILFADEPTGNLDERTSAAISSMLLDMSADNKEAIMVMVTHDLQLARRCTRAYKLQQGMLTEL